MVTRIETMLPASLLLKVGIYMQSFAHVEFAVWRTVMFADEIDVYSHEAYLAYLPVKRETTKLAPSLRKASSRVPAHIGLRLCLLAAKIDEVLPTRNLVAHGAFFVDGDAYGVLHFIRRNAKPKPQWEEIVGPITEQSTVRGIAEVDLLLKDAVEVRLMVEAWWLNRCRDFDTAQAVL
jgi:hypothetical protein